MPPDFIAAEEYILGELSRRLNPKLSYHRKSHTEDVMAAAMIIAKAESLGTYRTSLLRIAAAYHDCGFMNVYTEHEKEGCRIADEVLPAYGFGDDDLSLIKGMIMATKIPQSPVNEMERIICDADLDYLGRSDFYSIGNTLFEELKSFGKIETERQWNELQVKFLRSHNYHTPYSLRERKLNKESYLSELILRLEEKN